eukprot:7272041-Alexandrium_andersonii.AAC.1
MVARVGPSPFHLCDEKVSALLVPANDDGKVKQGPIALSLRSNIPIVIIQAEPLEETPHIVPALCVGPLFGE